ncbi:NAD(P)/FAD-dependent oxidoreductase [Streptosporangiaceae bacterium NEAU-GS5]|nr:NAD(P)/FAD-dependent oxidoreductase [Streptosporangiaceae bacterium NEAU-GS5]
MLTVAIIGAGFGGLCMAIQLEKAGIGTYTVFEKADNVGGTWRDNTYPGAGCDIPSHLYSFSFERYGNWTRRYPGQQEILTYLEHCAAKNRINVRLNTEVTALAYENGRWRVSTADGDEFFDIVVSAVGQLNRPKFPDIPGRFDGPVFHSARWDHSADLTKNVAVIGTGSSAAQLIPPLAHMARHLDVFQRTPNWVIPKPDAEFGPLMRQAFHYLPFLQRGYREWLYRYGEGALFPALVGGWSTNLLRRRALAHLAAQIPDPELRARLTPDYPVGCKRIVIDSRFYPALARANVSVVGAPIARLVPYGVETTDGRVHATDAIVYATGFQTTEFLMPMRVTGRDGHDLHEEWKSGAEAYLGIAVPHFPNLFLLYGPNTNLGHNSIVFMIECQVRYIMGCLRLIRQRGTMEVSGGAMTAWRNALDRALGRTVWRGDCRSWYKTADGRVTNNWPRPTTVYQRLTRAPKPEAYTFGGMF